MEQTLDFLIPTFDELSEAALKSALPDITDTRLRKAMLADQGLQNDMVSSILARHGLGPGIAATGGKIQGFLERIAQMKMPDLCLRLGAAGWSEGLSRAALTGMKDTDIPRDVLKDALRFRKFAIWPAEDRVPDKTAMQADGCQTLHCWLPTLSKEAAQLLSLRVEPGAARVARAEAEKRKLLCEAVLSHLCKAEVTQ